MRILLSIGYGRLHLIQSASYLAKRGIAVGVILGWVPKRANSVFVRLCSRMVGRDLSLGFRKRLVKDPNIHLHSCVFAEFFINFLFLLCRVLGASRDKCAVMGWRFFGWSSKKYIKNADVFHVRSGAGQGGAIGLARRRGMKVLADHSIAHPCFMEKHLKSEYERYGVRFDLGISSAFWQLVVKDCCDADLVLVNSAFVRDTFVDAGFPSEKIRIVYQGTRKDFFGLRDWNCVPVANQVLFTGGFGFRKGGEYILEAFKMLKNRNVVSCQINVVGSCSQAAPLIARYEADKLPVTFHGQVPQDDLKEYLAHSDLYLFPSLAEGCASSGMEAMAAGLCVVATKESGLPILDGETGFLVPAKDAKAIVDKLEWLFANPAEMQRVGKNAAALIAREYTWEKYAENVERVYTELLTV